MSDKEKDDYLTTAAKTYFGTYVVFGIVFGLLALALIAPLVWDSFARIFKAVPNVLASFLIVGVWLLVLFLICRIKNLAIRIPLGLIWLSPFIKYLLN